jgi:hypothetical protein
MTADGIRDFLHAVPFVPFLIHLPDRPAVRVEHPDFVALSRSGRTMAVYKENSDGFSEVDIALITEIEKQPRRITRKRSR